MTPLSFKLSFWHWKMTFHLNWQAKFSLSALVKDQIFLDTRCIGFTLQISSKNCNSYKQFFLGRSFSVPFLRVFKLRNRYVHWNFFIDFLEHYAQTVITKLKKRPFWAPYGQRRKWCRYEKAKKISILTQVLFLKIVFFRILCFSWRR